MAGKKRTAQQKTLTFDSEESEPAFLTPITENSTLGTSDTTLSVSELAKRIREVVDCPLLTDIVVRGEITGYRPNASGHLYFSLTEQGDDPASISCVMWKYSVKNLPFSVKDGLLVQATGLVDFYPAGGRLQFIVKKMEPALFGKAGLYLLKEQWRKELEAKGIIPRPQSEIRDPPLFPRNIGVVTSKTGSVLQDIKNVISRRYPLPILLAGTSVQGDGAEKGIVSAILSLQDKADVIIIARGGGSFEDLFIFNHPDVVTAIRNSAVPIISAIGHETDTTLSDFAADRRVPTPSAAAETVVPDRSVLLEKLEKDRRSIHDRMVRLLSDEKNRVAEMKIRVDPSRLTRKLDQMHLQTAELEERIRRAAVRRVAVEHEACRSWEAMIQKGVKNRITTARLAFLAQKEIILSRDPYKPLERGYALVWKDGAVVRSVKKIAKDDRLNLKLADGEITSIVESIK
ncbi:exodeoxyribonuclease VII large subunit [Methanocorpusculum bavaricum]|jgi:exodeoxyribonuclease VII large subunit|uniref:exodeoxyribonuclease VII large subunit n=1 Tax=Methanocorpusculum bavaricum TaxID=71518 RepID=UPI00069412E6|nr:exodeoxyribonuclease VII large subunit [Methanocorpusculum bavaricum]MDD2248443.1 exodeoxyribonuclease VII large subunit [Methanocorpusculum sp.]MDD2803078.1 exodeoxyribonuclease VII large subunit [Methanocorpusculum sp.]MDD3046806.1 exodeoxyribonuclease VII large subunit [Methanocorpusculum sp.]MDD3912225.1 exodeoxyribonuclease VII large subunit [Methanocorpusculum sp.]HJJ38441.1 exodeoxyribonuclease VII large subunit [Methanocorpusculum sp.]